MLQGRFVLVRSNDTVRTLYVGDRPSGGKITWQVKWDVPHTANFVVVASNDYIPFFTTLMLYFVNIAVQSLLHSWPMEIRDPVFRLSRMWSDMA